MSDLDPAFWSTPGKAIMRTVGPTLTSMMCGNNELARRVAVRVLNLRQGTEPRS